MGRETISSQELAEYTHINSTQIRRDLSGFGKFGKRGVGYRVESLVARDPQDPPHLGPAQHRPVRRRQPRPGDRQLRHLRRPRLPDRRDLRRRPEAGRQASSAASPVRALDDLEQVVSEEEVVVGVLAVPAAGGPGGRRPARRGRREDHLQLLRAAAPGAARGHRPHLEPRRRPALRALLLPGLTDGQPGCVAKPRPRARPGGVRGVDRLHGRARGGVRDRRSREPRARRTASRSSTRACQEDELLAESAAGELIDTEIEIRSGRGETFAEAVELQRERRARLFALAERAGTRARRRRARTPGRTTSTSGSSTPRTTTACARSCAGSRSATTPGACTSTSASAAPTARSPSATTCAGCCRRCWRSRPTRPSSTATTPACTRCAPRSSPAPSRAAGSTSRSATGPPTPTSSTC